MKYQNAKVSINHKNEKERIVIHRLEQGIGQFTHVFFEYEKTAQLYAFLGVQQICKKIVDTWNSFLYNEHKSGINLTN